MWSSWACRWGANGWNPVTPQYIADAVAWGAIGARTTESQVHRELASGLSMPVGFKNGTDGDAQVAIDACRAAAAPHTFFGVTPAGAAAVVNRRATASATSSCAAAGPGRTTTPATSALPWTWSAKAGLPRRLMVDASHGNSEKDYRRQPVVADALGEQIASGEQGLIGVMLESFITAGKQAPATPPAWSTVRVSPTAAWTSTPPRRFSVNWPPPSPPPRGSAGRCAPVLCRRVGLTHDLAGLARTVWPARKLCASSRSSGPVLGTRGCGGRSVGAAGWRNGFFILLDGDHAGAHRPAVPPAGFIRR